MGCFGPDAPEPRDYGKELKDTLEAQLEIAPRWYESEKKFRPLYVDLNLALAEQALPRLAALYEQSQPALARAEGVQQSERVQRELGLLQRYGPAATRAIREAAGTDALLRAMTAEAEASLRSPVNPYLVGQTAQQVRAAQAARGMYAAGQPSASLEALAGAELANRWRQQERQYAAQMVQMNQAVGGDPLLTLLARPSQVLGMTPGVLSGAYGMNPGNIFNPESPYAGNLYAANQAYDWQYKQATPSTLAQIGMVMDLAERPAKTAAEIFGKIAGGMVGCWVAREVYGEHNPRWRLFALWLQVLAPGWFRRAYQQRGERWAGWVRRHPWIKPWLRRWMDARVRRVQLMEA